MALTKRRLDLVDEAQQLLQLLHADNAALVQAGVHALADKAARMGDRLTQAQLKEMLRASVCGQTMRISKH